MCEFSYLKSCKMVGGKQADNIISEWNYYYNVNFGKTIYAIYKKPSQEKVSAYYNIINQCEQECYQYTELKHLKGYSTTYIIGGHNCDIFTLYTMIILYYDDDSIKKFIVKNTARNRYAVKLEG